MATLTTLSKMRRGRNDLKAPFTIKRETDLRDLKGSQNNQVKTENVCRNMAKRPSDEGGCKDRRKQGAIHQAISEIFRTANDTHKKLAFTALCHHGSLFPTFWSSALGHSSVI